MGVREENLARRPVSVSAQCALIHAWCSSRCSAGYSDPCCTCSSSLEICWPVLGDGPAVPRLKRNVLEDEKIERALNQIARFDRRVAGAWQETRKAPTSAARSLPGNAAG